MHWQAMACPVGRSADGTITGMRWLRVVFSILALALLAGGCGGGKGAAPESAKKQPRDGDPTAGKQVFLKAGCGICHTFKAAGTTKVVGPNLDTVAATYDEAFIRKSIVDPAADTEKIGKEPGTIKGDRPYYATMPSFGADADTPDQRLTDRELDDVVAFLTYRK
jgi:mono/diheme cytochrome c family protein